MAATQVLSSSIFAFFILIALPSFHTLPIVDEVNVNGRSSLEYGDKFQGDIVLTPSQEEMFNGTGKGSRTGLLDTRYRWPKNTAGQVIVPYTFLSSAGFSKFKETTTFIIPNKLNSLAQAEQNIVREGLQEIQSKSCVRFVARTTQPDYIEIINNGGCYSFLGRLGGKQELSLSRNGCVSKGTVMHEFIHALG